MNTKDYKIFNVTPHKLNIIKGDGNKINIEPCGLILRVKEDLKPLDDKNNLVLAEIKLEGLELDGDESKLIDIKREKKAIVVVPRLLIAYKKYLKKIFGDKLFCTPGDLVRDKDGNIIGAKGLYKF